MPHKKLIMFLASTLLVLCVAVSALVLPRFTGNSSVAHASYPSDGGLPSACYKAFPVLKKGSKGDWVNVLQGYLNDGYKSRRFSNSPYNFKPLLTRDGNFGSLTKNAVMDFQKARGLKVDGIVGPHTWYAINQCVTLNLA